MKQKTYNTIRKIISVYILISFLSFHLAILPKTTVAYYSDNEISDGNNFIAGKLDAYFTASNFTNDFENKISLGKPLFAGLDILSSSSVNANYYISTSPIEDDEYNTDFCRSLVFSMGNKASSAISFSGNLNNFSSSPLKLNPSQSFDVNLGLKTGSDEFEEAECSFNLSLFAGQTPSTSLGLGFFDRESKLITVESYTPEIHASISPIQDSTIDHNRPNDNLGNDNVFRVKSEEGKERRGLVSFRYKLPSNLALKYSQLVFTIKDAPQTSRIYKINRIIDSWLESNVTWNNQPAIDINSSLLANTGTTKNAKVAWDVTSDVQDRITAGQTHNGWMVSDTDEQTSKSIQTNFYSRETSNYADKPKLVLVFDVPQVNTDHLVINEVYYDVDSPKGSEAQNEWVEIYNPTTSSISLDGWSLCDSQGCDKIASSDYEIPGKGFAVIANNESTWNTYWTLPEKAIRIPLGSSIGKNGLSNAGDAVKLLAPDNTVTDQLSYGAELSVFNPSINQVRKGDSISRIIKGFDNNVVDDFIENIKPNPGTNPSETDETLETLTIFEDGFMMQAGEQEIVPVLDQEILQNISDSNIILNDATQSYTQTASQPEESGLDIASESLTIESTASTSVTVETQDNRDESDTTPTDPDLQSVTSTENSNDTSIMSNSEAIIEEPAQETTDITDSSDDNNDSESQDTTPSNIPQGQDNASTNNNDS